MLLPLDLAVMLEEEDEIRKAGVVAGPGPHRHLLAHLETEEEEEEEVPVQLEKRREKKNNTLV